MAKMWAAEGAVAYIYIYVYIYIFIYIISGPKKVKNSAYPLFYRKWPRNKKHTHTHLVWGFFTFQCFFVFLIFAFSCLSFSFSPLLLDFLKPKIGPSNEVIGYYMYVYVYVYMYICIYIYMYMRCRVRKWGVSFPYAFENAPGHAFENGVRSVRWRETPFLQCLWVSRAQQLL